LVKVTSTIPKDKVDTAKKYEKAQEHDGMAEEEYEKATELAEQWETHIKQTQEDVKQNKTRRRDAIPLRNITSTAQLAANLWQLQKITCKNQWSSWPMTTIRSTLSTSGQLLALP
jgi:hypothetical protein